MVERRSHGLLKADELMPWISCWDAALTQIYRIATEAHRSDSSTLAKLVWEDRPDLIKFMMRFGTDPAHKDKYGRTALHAAAVCGHLNSAKALLSAGADVNAVDNSGLTPLQTALINKEAGVARELLKNRASTAGIMSKDWHRVSEEGDGKFALLSEAFSGERHLEFPEAIDNFWDLFKEYPQRKNFLM
ncbi:hypothetical protein A9Z42_0047670 [Trichoderma parareesei]|uniref:Uncharacterized protein n=1 Tax=Trichoderma parareesei TaxID=858221 RepID=A0A2H2ZA28_TRIPA|nr:hypothetical protein A9Z42_0047670 [Trichoderma parareesei]